MSHQLQSLKSQYLIPEHLSDGIYGWISEWGVLPKYFPHSADVWGSSQIQDPVIMWKFMRFLTWVGNIVEWYIYRPLGLMCLIATFLPPSRSLSLAPSTFRPTIFFDVFFFSTVETFPFFSLLWVWTFDTFWNLVCIATPRWCVITSPTQLPILFK